MELKNEQLRLNNYSLLNSNIEVAIILLPLFSFFYWTINISIDHPGTTWFFGPILCVLFSFYLTIKHKDLSCSKLFLGIIIWGGIITILKGKLHLFDWFFQSELIIIIYVSLIFNKEKSDIFLLLIAFYFIVFVIIEIITSLSLSLPISSTSVGIGNPIFVGESLAFVSVFLLPFYFKSEDVAQKATIIVVIFLSFLLQIKTNSRTGVIGSLCSVIYMFTIYRKINKRILCASFFFIVAVIWALILVKNDSTLGRILIYKISFKHILDYVYTGLGIGSSQFHYLSWQEEYFQLNAYTDKEALLADNVYFVYNEFLKKIIETGIVGLILFCLPILLLFKKVPEKLLTFKGVIFLVYVQSFFSNPLNTWLCTFLFYFSIVNLEANIRFIRVNKSLMLFKTFFLLLLLIYQGSLYYLWGKTSERSVSSVESNRIIFSKIYPLLNTSNAFLADYGTFLAQAGDYDLSLPVLKRAALLMNNSKLLDNIGNIYFVQKNYTSAAFFFCRSSNMVPNRFYPLRMLLQIYISTKEYSKAVDIAKKIISKKIKVNSPFVQEAVSEATFFLKQNHMRHNTNFFKE